MFVVRRLPGVEDNMTRVRPRCVTHQSICGADMRKRVAMMSGCGININVGGWKNLEGSSQARPMT